ncbi:metal ABC transporter solute-binding protein, Zn/Mn family [Paenibacillus harenae]|uniref:metal ABC transporter solute-binding protein, Zn/Mn family n=1 Tax=Paenibacillus harenae TaxID=306543 RepID=UPI002791DB67|nr:zinc ABC transporter substrate-binding protein [Paenibacillus harenae]MDQ0058317.1 zinc transport system substrate-binding protein [Paenibacillus harenae]
MRSKTTGIRYLAISMVATIALLTAACGNQSNNTNTGGNAEQDGKLSVVTSFYPLYFLAKEIGGEHVSVVNLVAAGVEPHDWTPKSRDLSTASNANLFLYHGAGLEGWVEDFQKGLSKDSGVAVKEMSEGIALIHAEEAEQEHEGEEVHEGEEEHEGEEGHDHEGMDPHTWVSPKSALVLAENIKNSLVEADESHKADYEQNFAALQDKLVAIDEEYTSELAGASKKDIVVSHQAFGYLARDYGLNQVAIMGLSPEAEPRAQDLLEITKFVEENDVSVIFFEELVSDSLAKTLADEADVETLVLNPMEGLTSDQEKAGESYLTLMERNLQNLMQALQ